MPDKKEKPKRIKDVSVNRAAVKKADNLEAFKKANPEIFSHLSDEDQAAAYGELWAEGYSSAVVALSGKPATGTSTTQDPAKP